MGTAPAPTAGWPRPARRFEWMHVLTWNCAGRVQSVGRQAQALAERPGDVVALQEIRATALGAWETELAALGYPHVAATLPAEGVRRARDRRLGVLGASRPPIELCPPLDVPWPERHLAVRAQLDGVVVELHNLHAPLSG